MAIFELLDYIVNEVWNSPMNTIIFVSLHTREQCIFFISGSGSDLRLSVSHQPPPKLPLGVYTSDFQDFVTKWWAAFFHQTGNVIWLMRFWHFYFFFTLVVCKHFVYLMQCDNELSSLLLLQSDQKPIRESGPEVPDGGYLHSFFALCCNLIAITERRRSWLHSNSGFSSALS